MKNNILDSILQSDSKAFGEIVANKDTLRVQIIYTQINRDKDNRPVFTDYTFNLNNDQYFYPASTVKMPVALLALEKLNELNIAGLDKNTAMITDSSFAGQQRVLVQPINADGKPTVADYIKQIFLVSDNDAFNRLYEFVGQEAINKRMHDKGYADMEILHRLSVPLSAEQNRHTNAVSFYDTAGNVLHSQPPAYNGTKYSSRNTSIGKGYYKAGRIQNEPFDFSTKNRISLATLHQVLRSVVFPEAVPPAQRFNLTENDYSFLYRYMSMVPRQSEYPGYDSAQYWDAYVKFLLYGSEKGTLPDNIRIFNKVGDAYGFLTDVAYIIDTDKKIEFMLSATILCNRDGIFNDDKYDYDTLGFPFMKQLGQSVYQYELNRKRSRQPDLTRFMDNYNNEK